MARRTYPGVDTRAKSLGGWGTYLKGSLNKPPEHTKELWEIATDNRLGTWSSLEGKTRTEALLENRNPPHPPRPQALKTPPKTLNRERIQWIRPKPTAPRPPLPPKTQKTNCPEAADTFRLNSRALAQDVDAQEDDATTQWVRDVARANLDNAPVPIDYPMPRHSSENHGRPPKEKKRE
jgi:hypothetical protein